MIVAVVPLAALEPVMFTETPVEDVWLLDTFPPLIWPFETEEETTLAATWNVAEL